MEFWTDVRRRVLTGQLSKRAACPAYELSWNTLQKILTHDEPPGYRQRSLGRSRSWTAVLSVRTFCTFLREFSPFFLIRPCDLKCEPWS